ncbi:MAG: NUDIX hydrolase [Chloroflexota bacterium]
MKLFADGIVTNEFNQALFILHGDTRTWTQPGGAVEQGELPTQTVEREIEEETGLVVRAVRLVGVYYREKEPDDMLIFTFRCIQRGGELQTSEESPRAGFMDVAPPPTPMLELQRERLERALAHDGGPPYWGLQQLPTGVRLLQDLASRARELVDTVRRRTEQEAPDWHVAANVILRNEQGAVLWVRRNDHDVWNLPGGGRQNREPPWQTALRETREETGLEVTLTHLSGVYTKPPQDEVVFTFLAEHSGGELRRNAEAAEFAYFAPGEEPENSLPKHVERVADAAGVVDTTVFREQAGPPGLEVLGLK